MGAAGVLAVLVLVGATVLVVPMLLAMAGACYAAWRWWSAMAVAARMNDEVRSTPGRHARADEGVDVGALVPGQRSESPVLPPTAAGRYSVPAAGSGDRTDAGRPDAGRPGSEQTGEGQSGAGPTGEGRHRSPSQ
jgi:hypothetical protein